MRKKNLELVFAVVLERMHSVFGIQDLAEMRWTLERMSCLHQPQPSTFKICVMSDMLFRSMCDVRHAVQIHVMHLSSCRAAVVSWVLLGSLLRLIQDALFTFNKCFNHFCINGSGCGYGQMEFFLLSHKSNKFFLKKKTIHLFYYVFEYCACMYAWAPHARLILKEFRRGYWIFWYWSYKWLWEVVCARNWTWVFYKSHKCS